MKLRGSKGRKTAIKNTATSDFDSGAGDAAELEDFGEYLAEEIFSHLPLQLRTLSFAAVQEDTALAKLYETPLDSEVVAASLTATPGSVSDSLCSYGLMDEAVDLDRFLSPVLDNYVAAATSAPSEFTPSATATRPADCEICQRSHLPLTYHHLIPRAVHAKAVKRGWHRDWELNKVAWLCRACHSFVHRVATNEELAREWYDVGLLLQREDVRRFADWVGRVRWKAR